MICPNTALETILKEYFLQRDDGGAFFDIMKQEDRKDFDEFLTEEINKLKQ